MLVRAVGVSFKLDILLVNGCILIALVPSDFCVGWVFLVGFSLSEMIITCRPVLKTYSYSAGARVSAFFIKFLVQCIFLMVTC